MARSSNLAGQVSGCLQSPAHPPLRTVLLRKKLIELCEQWEINRCCELGNFRRFTQLRHLLKIDLAQFNREFISAKLETIFGIEPGTLPERVLQPFKRYKGLAQIPDKEHQLTLTKLAWQKAVAIAHSNGRTLPDRNDAEAAYKLVENPRHLDSTTYYKGGKWKERREELEAEIEALKRSGASSKMLAEINSLRMDRDDAIAQRNRLWRKVQLLEKENKQLKQKYSSVG